MPLKSIVEIDVQDERFKAFQANFDRYREALATTPGAWQEMAAGTMKASAAFDRMVEKARAQTVSARMTALVQGKAAEVQAKAEYDALSRQQKFLAGLRQADATAGRMADKVARANLATAKMAGNLAGSAVSLLKWTSAIGVLSALAGAGGGLFGIDRMAQGAAAMRRLAMSSGVPVGQQRAFDLDYGRFGDTQAITGNIATAKSDITSKQFLGLRGAGIGSDEIQRKTASDLGVELFDKLPGLFRKGADDPLLGAQAEARGLTSVLSVEDIKRYLRSSPEERQAQKTAYGRDSRDLGFDGGTGRAWQDFVTRIERAKDSIETTFIRGLVPLAGPLGNLSKGVVDLADAFLKSDAVKGGIEGMAAGLESFAKFVGTDEFKEDVKTFADDVSALAKGIRRGLEWLGVFPSKAGAANVPDPAGSHEASADLAAGSFGASLRNRRGGLGRQLTDFDTMHDRLDAFRRGEPATPGRGSRAWRNNNPGNIGYGKFAKEHGADATDGRFAHFPDYATGRKAQEDLWFNSDLYKGLTLSEAVAKWSPPSENDTAGITRGYASAIGIDPNTPLSQFTAAQRAKLLDAQQAREGWTPGARAGVVGGQNSTPGHVRGLLKIDGETYQYGSGGVRGSAHIPYGTYPINPESGNPWGQAHNAMDVNGNGSIWDAALGRMRTGIEMHEAHSVNMVTEGCMAFLKEQYPRLKEKVRAMVAKTGHAYLHVGEHGASITSSPDEPKDGEGVSLGRQAGTDLKKAVADQHLTNMRRVLAAHQGRALPWQHHGFAADVQRAQSESRIRRAQEDQRRQDGPQHTSGLGLDKLQRRTGHDISIYNASGADVGMIAGPASYG